jgi:hypothetical protein
MICIEKYPSIQYSIGDTLQSCVFIILKMNVLFNEEGNGYNLFLLNYYKI